MKTKKKKKNIDQGQEVIIRKGKTGCRAKVLMSELLINAMTDQQLLQMGVTDK